MLLGWGPDAFTTAKERHRMILTKTEIVEALRAHRCVIKFTKVNGEVREMPCTLRPDVIPSQPQVVQEASADSKTRKTNDNIVSVWCLDKQAWRSFRVDSVLELRLDLGMPVVL